MAKISASMVSTLYLISVAPACFSSSEDVSVGYTETPIGRSYRALSAFTIDTAFLTSSSGDFSTPLVREMALSRPVLLASCTSCRISSGELYLSVEFGNRAELTVINAAAAYGQVGLLRTVAEGGLEPAGNDGFSVFNHRDIGTASHNLERGVLVDRKPHPVAA